ncbi:MAG: CapA family protein [Clostridiales bacterium]|nr:CapA family protein [Clostridiales bacterium]
MFIIKNYHFRYIKTVLYVLLSLSLVVMLIVLAVVNIRPANNVNISSSPTPTSTNKSETTNKVKIQLAGDVVLNSNLLTSSSNSYGEFNFDNIFKSIKNSINGDLAIFNMEGIIDAYKDGSQIAGAPIFNYPKEIANSLKNAGFNMCITANDRASYFSDAGIINNYQNILNSGMLPVGTSLEGNKNFAVSEINGIKIAVLAYTDKLSNFDKITLDRISSLDFEDIEGTIDAISEDVAYVKNQGAEIIVASMHWGDEMASEPNESQRELADKMAKCGVDIIYGTRSHVFQPVTFKNIVDDNNNSKNIIVAYSMGNLLSHPTVTSGETTQQSAILNIYIERDQSGKAYISTAECEPIYIYANSLKNNNYEYHIVSSSEYYSVQERPQIFANDSDWKNCKDAYDNIKKIIEQSGKNGMPLGLK